MMPDDKVFPADRIRPGKLRWILLILVAGLIVYGNSYPGDWVFDDTHMISRNSTVGVSGSLHSLFSAPPGSPASGRPLTALSFNLSWLCSGNNPAAFRAFNVVIHLACALVAFGLLQRLFSRVPRLKLNAPGLAGATCLLWVVHPLNTSTITYISQRAEALMALFMLLSLYAFTRRNQAGCLPLRWKVICVFAGWCSLLSKEVGLMTPLLLVLMDRVLYDGTWRAVWQRTRGLLFLLLIPGLSFLLWSYAGDPRHGTVRLEYQGINPWTYLCTQSWAITMYVRKLLWPSPLILDYGWPIARHFMGWLPHAVILSGVLFAGGRLLVRGSLVGFALVSFFILLAPSSSVVPIITEIAAEHRFYLPGVIVVALLVVGIFQGLEKWIRHPRIRNAVRGSILALCVVTASMRTLEQNALYRDPVALWRHNAEVTPLNRRCLLNLAVELRRAGRPAEAIPVAREALRVSPDFPDAHAELSYEFFELHLYEEALPPALTAVQLEPEQPEHFYTLAMVLGRLSREEDAFETVRKGLVNHPDSERLMEAGVILLFLFDRPEDALRQLGYWSDAPMDSPEFIARAVELARVAGRPDYADELLKHTIP